MTLASLQSRLDEITQNTRRLVQPERLAISEASIAELFATGIEDRILSVGAAAPSFDLPDAISGKTVHSADLLALGPLVVNFFRGRWDPYCITELETWRDLNTPVRNLGGLLVSISPQTLRQSDFTVQQHGIQFPILRDEHCTVAAKFGVAYVLSEQMRRYYSSILVNIPFINSGRNPLAHEKGPTEDWTLPLPATFVITQDGRIAFSEAHADFRVRPEPQSVLDVLESLKR